MSVEETLILSPTERFLHLSSEYATETLRGTAECKFRVTHPVSPSNDSYCMAIGIHNASIPHTWYNVYGTRFRMWFSNVAGNIIEGAIPAKNYTITGFITAMQTAINAQLTAASQPATFVVAYNSDTNFITYSYDVVALQSPWYFLYVDQNCYLEQGLRLLSSGRVNTVASTLTTVGVANLFTLTPAAMVDLSSFHGVYVNLVNSTSNQQASYSSLAMTNIIARIPVRNPFGAIETYEPDNITYVYMPGASLTDIHIGLTGDDGSILDLHGVDWTMTMHVKYMAIRQPESPIQRGMPVGTIQSMQGVGGRVVY